MPHLEADTFGNHIDKKTPPVKRDFKENWLHTNKKAKVKEIFFIDERATEREGGRMGQLMTLFHSWR